MLCITCRAYTRKYDALAMQRREKKHVLGAHEGSTDRDRQTLLPIRGLSDEGHPLSVRA
jgi:hypothetical protein